MMGFVLQYYHHAAGEILSQHVPHLLLFETRYLNMLNVRYLAAFFMLQVTVTTILGD